MLSGSNDLHWISTYNSGGDDLSTDGQTLPAAVGFRMRSASGGDQLHSAIQLLRTDPSSRRAICYLALPEDVLHPNRDVPCASTVQFFIRAGRLDAVVVMRSQSAFGVLPYDLFLFCQMQGYVANELGLELGRYTHIAGSLHLYEDELEQVDRTLSAPILAVRTSTFSPASSLLKATSVERQIRMALEATDGEALSRIARGLGAFNGFYQEALAVIGMDVARRLGLEVTAQAFRRVLSRDAQELMAPNTQPQRA